MQRRGVFRSKVILGNDQVHTLVAGVGMKVLIRNWEPRLFMILEVVQNLETKGKTIQKSVFHEGRGVTERSVDETRIAVWGVDDPGLLRGWVVSGLCGYCSGVQGDQHGCLLHCLT